MDKALQTAAGRAVLADFVARELAEQPWWKKSANTVTTAVAGLVAVAWWIAGTGMDLPDPVTWIVGVVLFAGQVLGVKATKNGVTWTTQEQLEKAVEDPKVRSALALLAESALATGQEALRGATARYEGRHREDQ